MAKQSEKPLRPKVTIIPGRGVGQTINYLLEDRDHLEWLVAVGRRAPARRARTIALDGPPRRREK